MGFIEAYEEWKIYASRRHKKQCLDTLTQNFNKHVLPYFIEKDIQDLTIQDVIFWQNSIIDMNYSNNYNKNLYCCFNSFLDYCVLNSYINSNYLKIVGSFKKKFEHKEYNIYNYFEFKKFRKGLNNIVYRYFFDFLFFYGTRSGEAMALKFSDLSNKRLYVGSSMRRRGKREIDSPKTSNSERILYLKPIMRFKLFILKCYYIKIYGDSGYDYFIFGGKTPLSPTSIKRHKHNACINRNMREITTHEFRHSFATRMIKLHVPVYKVSRMLGHSSIAITMDIYVHNKKREININSINSSNTLTQNFNKALQSIITHFV